MHQFPIRSAAPDRVVPPGRIGYDLDADVLLLHTVQTSAAFDVLLTTGSLRANPVVAESPWPEAYGWMNRMMAARLPTSGDAALWLWAKTLRYDLVGQCRRARGQVLLTCRIPRERVLLSEFDEWHGPLNSWLVVTRHPGESDEEHDRRHGRVTDDFRARLDAACMWFAPIGQWPVELRNEAEQSWEGIFDRDVFPKTSHWQATVHEIAACDVVEAVRIE